MIPELPISHVGSYNKGKVKRMDADQISAKQVIDNHERIESHKKREVKRHEVRNPKQRRA